MTESSGRGGRALTIVVILVAALLLYAVLLGQRGWVLITSGQVVSIVMGVAVLVLPLVGLYLVAMELRFGLATQKLTRRLDAEGGLPVDDLPKRPSGRVEREAADERFAERKAEVKAAPEDWRTWFRLGLAYDDAGDRRRARAAMRQAITLSKKDSSA